MRKLRREIKIYPAYDKRNSNPAKNYGISSCKIIFGVIGDKGAITLSFITNWFLPATVEEYKRGTLSSSGQPLKMDLEKEQKPIESCSWDYHSKKKKNEYLTPIEECEWTGGKCYCDGSYLRANSYLPLLIEKGSEEIFKKLEEDYRLEFEGVSAELSLSLSKKG